MRNAQHPTTQVTAAGPEVGENNSRFGAAKSIYVESWIAAPVEDLWTCTQVPALHQRWDVRFRTIDYLPCADGEPQQFRYATTVAPGLSVEGHGETIGERHRPDGTAYSALEFWSDHRLSLIRRGSGFWRYVPIEGGVRFLTRFDYTVRWGIAGRFLDRLFRPLFGWGTAWSFDRLRLWVEEGVPPERSRDQSLAHAIAVVSVAFVWVYHGLVPKVLAPGSGELDLLTQAAPFLGNPGRTLLGIGLLEVAFGIAVLVWWRQRWPYVATLVAMPLFTLGALAGDYSAFVRPFNPVTLNLALMSLAAIALVTADGLPTARNTLRSPSRKEL